MSATGNVTRSQCFRRFQRLTVGGWDISPTFSSYKLVWCSFLPVIFFSMCLPAVFLYLEILRELQSKTLQHKKNFFIFPFLSVSFSAHQTSSLCMVSSRIFQTLSFGLVAGTQSANHKHFIHNNPSKSWKVREQAGIAFPHFSRK